MSHDFSLHIMFSFQAAGAIWFNELSLCTYAWPVGACRILAMLRHWHGLGFDNAAGAYISCIMWSSILRRLLDTGRYFGRKFYWPVQAAVQGRTIDANAAAGQEVPARLQTSMRLSQVFRTGSCFGGTHCPTYLSNPLPHVSKPWPYVAECKHLAWSCRSCLTINQCTQRTAKASPPSR